MIAIPERLPTVSLATLHQHFVARLLPRITVHARIVFRGYGEEQQAELTADSVALAWSWYTRLYERGKDAATFPATFASFVVRAVKCGRRLTGMDKAKDVLSRRAQARHGFRVEAMPATTRAPRNELYGAVGGQRLQDEHEECLRENVRTPVPDQVNFRVSFPAFLGRQTTRDRRLARHLSLGHSGKNAAQKFGLSPGRVTQIRQRLCREWYAMHDEQAPGS
jgi:hypothetical protein